jgi:bifunctional non-homologous end joining protein LigD
MRFEPFIAPKLLRPRRGPFLFNVPVQLSLIPENQLGTNFALRLHDASRLHFDFRIQILGTLFCLVLFEAPSLNPARAVGARLMMDHDPRYLDSEHVIPHGHPGAGPTMPVDLGKCLPIVRTYATYEQEMLDQLARGDFRFTLNGRHLMGGWQLFSRGSDLWSLRKLEDEHASTTRILRLDRSVKTGDSLDDLRRRFRNL